MKKRILNLVTIFILITMIVQITSISNAGEVSTTEKQKIEKFLNDDENVFFSYYTYSKVSEIPLNEYEIENLFKKQQLTEEECKNAEINAIVNDFKAYSFKKEDANTFLQSKIGINFDELDAYKEYEKSHTTSTDKETFYVVSEGGGPAWPSSKYDIDSVKKMDNGNIEVGVVYVDNEYYQKDIEYYRVHKHIVTLKPYNDSYLFISSIEDETTKSRKTDEKSLQDGDYSSYIGTWQKFETWSTEIPEYELTISKIQDKQVTFSYEKYKTFKFENQTATFSSDYSKNEAFFTIADENDYTIKGIITFCDNIIILNIYESNNPLVKNVMESCVYYTKSNKSILSEKTTNDNKTEENKIDEKGTDDDTTVQKPITKTGITENIVIVSVTVLLGIIVIIAIIALVKYKKGRNM